MKVTIPTVDFDTITIVDANGEHQTFYLKEELRINQFNVMESFYEHPAKYVYWSSLLEQARLQLEQLQLSVEKQHALLYQPSISFLRAEGFPKPTKDQIEAHILLDKTYYADLEQLNVLQETVRKLQSVVKAFEHRRDMLIQIGADQRREKAFSTQVTMPQQNN